MAEEILNQVLPLARCSTRATAGSSKALAFFFTPRMPVMLLESPRPTGESGLRLMLFLAQKVDLQFSSYWPRANPCIGDFRSKWPLRSQLPPPCLCPSRIQYQPTGLSFPGLIIWIQEWLFRTYQSWRRLKRCWFMYTQTVVRVCHTTSGYQGC